MADDSDIENRAKHFAKAVNVPKELECKRRLDKLYTDVLYVKPRQSTSQWSYTKYGTQQGEPYAH
jgi:hypothetical protein